jgi:hypothetical protein
VGAAAQAAVLAALEQQARWCANLGSPFNAALMAAARDWLQDEPAALATLAAASPDPLAGAVALRLAGALHGLALQGCEPWASLWPQPGRGTQSPAQAALREACARAWAHKPAHLASYLATAPQTNEVMRSAALWPGWLRVQQRTGARALRVLEIGASAGLNLYADRYAHEHRLEDGSVWRSGHAASTVRLTAQWRGPVPNLACAESALRVSSRAACDLAPVALNTPAARERLLSYVWPDQLERLERTRQALQTVAGLQADGEAAVLAAAALPFLHTQLTRPAAAGECTLIQHSVVWQYLPASEQALVKRLIEQHGQAASVRQPLAWLRLEPAADANERLPDGGVELRCRLWPGGQDERLAVAHPHGAWVRWLAG